MEGGCCCARHPAMHSRRRTGASAACAARENGFGVIVPGARVVRESPGDASPENVLLYRRPVNTYRAFQRARHLQGLPIAIPSHATRHSTARPLGGAEVDRRRRPFRDTTSWTRKNTRDFLLAAKISSHPKPPSKQERGTRSTCRLGARDRPHESAGRHAIALGRFDRAFSVPATEISLLASLNTMSSRTGTAKASHLSHARAPLTRPPHPLSFLPLPHHLPTSPCGVTPPCSPRSARSSRP